MITRWKRYLALMMSVILLFHSSSFASLAEKIEGNPYDTMTIEELKVIAHDRAEAATEVTGLGYGRKRIRTMGEASEWSFDTYYVNEDASHHVEKHGDFNLKYQMEFHTSHNHGPNEVAVRIPMKLLDYRDGDPVTPTDIGVPYGTPEDSQPVRTSPFNYYFEDMDQDGENDTLVFFNYKEIQSGTNAAWQVLYKNLDAARIVDQTEWELEPEISVTIIPSKADMDSDTEEKTLEPLTGIVDTEVHLSRIDERVYREPGKSYTPGLYTEKQLRQYVRTVPETYTGENFDDYVFVIWEIEITGSGNQPFHLTIIDRPTMQNSSWINGEIVGNTSGLEWSAGKRIELVTAEDTSYQKGSWKRKYQVVTAYPKEMVSEGMVLSNSIQVDMVPYDQRDEREILLDRAEWTYSDYEWKYPTGQEVFIDKLEEERIYGWLELFRRGKERAQDMGNFAFQTIGYMRGYRHTHTDSSNGQIPGQYKAGTSYTLTTMDDFMYVDTGGESRVLSDEDYYFTSVEVNLKDDGYDVWEDRTSLPEAAPEDSGIDQSVRIYAIYKGEADWELAAEIPWEESGEFSYTFSDKQIERQPWRVKAVHRSINYSTTCLINVEVRLRHDSPIFAEILEQYVAGEITSMKLQDISGIIAQVHGPDDVESVGLVETQIHESDSGLSTESDNGLSTELSTEPVFVGESTKYVHKFGFPAECYEKENMRDDSKELYQDYSGIDASLPQRASAVKFTTGLEKEAQSYKTAKIINDAVNARALIDYYLTAHDGYLIHEESMMKEFQAAGIESPGRNEVVFYDLLPYAVQFEPSTEVKAGRITQFGYEDTAYRSQSGLWDTTQVTVETDVTQNWNGTNRTMVKFTIHYDGADPAVFLDRTYTNSDQNLWAEGWGLRFRAYYSWEDMDTVEAEENICVFTSNDRKEIPIYGKDNEIYTEGEIPDLHVEENLYLPLKGVDLDGDGQLYEGSVLYANLPTPDEDVSIANSSGVIKTVKADGDEYGVFGYEAVVEPGCGYTYDIKVTNMARNEITGIVIYDRLEHAEVERKNNGNDRMQPFAGAGWCGTFQDVVTTGLEELGITPVIYYNASRDALVSQDAGDENTWNPEQEDLETETGGLVSPKQSSDQSSPADILNVDYGWYTEEEWEEEGRSRSEVKAVAVNLGDYELPANASVSVQIRMQAPDWETAEKIGTENIYAYNNPVFYCKTSQRDSDEAVTEATVAGDSVRVSLHRRDRLEVIKEIVGDAPEEVQTAVFEFQIKRKEVTGQEMVDGKPQPMEEWLPFAYQEYHLYQKDHRTGEWIRRDEGVKHSTDGNGYLFLEHGTKAVFHGLLNVSEEEIQVSEIENPFWKVTVNDVTVPDSEGNLAVREITFQNQYRPVLFVQKKLTAVPQENMEEIKKTEFTFQLQTRDEEGNFIAVADSEFWYVDSVRMDGGIPKKVTTLGDDGIGRTDSNGRFTIRAGEILALAPGVCGSEYRLEEISSDWICTESVKEGIVESLGNQETIENIYPWKDLYLKKTITNRVSESMECFTFKVEKVVTGEEGTDQEGEEMFVPVSGNPWVLLNPDGTPVTEASGQNPSIISGILASDGSFSAPCGNKMVRIGGLEAGENYVITEMLTDDMRRLYEPENGGVAEVKMPVYSTDIRVEMRNDYLKRPLSVTKYVTGDTEGAASELEFEMTIMLDPGDGMKPLAEFAYTVTKQGEIVRNGKTTEDGAFFLKTGETATFEEAGLVGTGYEVTETPIEGSEFPQIYPIDHASHTGTINRERNELTFVNGTAGTLLLGKEYIGVDEAGKAYVDSMKNNATLRKRGAVTLTLELYREDGSLFWPEDGLAVTIIDSIGSGTGTKTAVWNEHTSYVLNPWEMLSIDAALLTDVVSYKLTESEADQNRIIRGTETDTWLEVSQLTSSNSSALQGTIREKPMAVMINQIDGIEKKSEIIKAMSIGADPVPEGAMLVWKLEQYDGSLWNPAAGIRYMTLDGSGATCDRVLETGKDGKIVLRKTEKGYPKVRFPEEEVKINLYQGMKKGDFRLVEVPDETSDAWGMLAGYAKADAVYHWNYHMSPEEATVLVNSNRTTPVKIRKEMERESEETFTMLLEQILSTSVSWPAETAQITERQKAAGIPYTVYRTETEEMMRSDMTTAKGEIFLKAGEYALLLLPDATLWTVSEKQLANVRLKEMSGSAGNQLTKLESNLMLVHQSAEQIGLMVTNVIDPKGFIPGKRVNRENLEVQVYYSDGTVRMLEADEYTITTRTSGYTTDAVGIERTDRLRIQYGVLSNDVVVDTNRMTTLYADDVKGAAVEAILGETGELLGTKPIATSGSLTIPTYIVRNGQIYVVSQIGVKAFENYKEITELIIPETVTKIGDSAFYRCEGIKEVTIPKSVKTLGEKVFRECKGLTEITIPETVKEIGRYPFWKCENLKKATVLTLAVRDTEGLFYECYSLTEVKLPEELTALSLVMLSWCTSLQTVDIPSSVKKLGPGVFEYCHSLTTLTLPEGIETIGLNVFHECTSLEELKIPDSVTTIGNQAFLGSTALKRLIFSEQTKLTTLERCAFRNCTAIEGMDIPDTVTSIGEHAYEGASSLKELVIPQNVMTIGPNCFLYCGSLTSLTILRTDSSQEVPSGAPWGNTNSNLTITVRYLDGSEDTVLYPVAE